MTQEEELLKILGKNKSIQFILEHAGELNIPNWYLAAGSVAQSVWNILHGFEPEFGIKDYDIVYYDSSDLSYEAEDEYIKKSTLLFRELNLPVEIKNEARVHLWYKDRFGEEIEPYLSVEEAIESWATTAQCVGVRLFESESKIYAPYGLDDLLNMIIRPNNKSVFISESHKLKIERWKSTWPKLKIL